MKSVRDEIDKTQMSRIELERLIDNWIMSERDRRIFRRHVIDGVRYEPLSEEFGISVTQAKRIVYKGLQKLLSKWW